MTVPSLSGLWREVLYDSRFEYAVIHQVQGSKMVSMRQSWILTGVAYGLRERFYDRMGYVPFVFVIRDAVLTTLRGVETT